MLESFLHQGKKATNVFCVDHPFQAILSRTNFHIFIFKFFSNFIFSLYPQDPDPHEDFARIRIRKKKMWIRNSGKGVMKNSDITVRSNGKTDKFICRGRFAPKNM